MTTSPFPSAIRSARVKQGLTQADLARQLGVTAAFVSKLERGFVNESERIAVRCHEVLGVRRDDCTPTSPVRSVPAQIPLMLDEPASNNKMDDPFLKLLPNEMIHSQEPDVRIWDIPQTITDLAYLTHGFFRYYGKFPPTLARKLIRDFRPHPSSLVFDNFLGSGTTLVEARLEGCQSAGIDSSPLAILASRVKVDTDVDLNAVKQLLRALQNLMREVSVEPPAGRAYDKWFATEVIEDLAKLRAGILTFEPSAVRRFLSLAYFAIIRRVSTAHDGEVRPHVNPVKRPRDVWLAFAKKVEEMIERAEEYRRYASSAPSAQAFFCDARSPEPVLKQLDRAVGLVVSHPPYLNCFDYIPVYKLEYMWTDGFSELESGWDYRSLPGGQLKSWPASDDVVRSYFSGLRSAYANLVPHLRVDAHVAVVLGDCTSHGKLVPVLDMFTEDMASVGYRLRRTILRTTHYGIGKYAYAHRADYHGTKAQKRDGVLVFSLA